MSPTEINTEITKAAELLKNGSVVAIPTETVYGLAASIKIPAAIDLIFKTKQRPFFDPLIVHIAHLVQIKSVVSDFPEIAQFLAEKFWPGPLTMVLPKHPTLNPKITSGLDRVGVRWPKHTIAQKIINTLGHPVAAPSANLFGKTSPTTAAHVKTEFGNKVFVVDGGTSEVGIESTVIGFDTHFTQVHIYRPGAITQEMLSSTIDKYYPKSIPVFVTESPAAPGQLQHHYMPSIPLVLVYDTSAKQDLNSEAFKKIVLENLKLEKWSPREIILEEDPTLAARSLYQKLRESSQAPASVLLIRINDQMKSGLWDAILDRLTKAAKFSVGGEPKPEQK